MVGARDGLLHRRPLSDRATSSPSPRKTDIFTCGHGLRSRYWRKRNDELLDVVLPEFGKAASNSGGICFARFGAHFEFRFRRRRR
jgi:hypothetical protein